MFHYQNVGIEILVPIVFKNSLSRKVIEPLNILIIYGLLNRQMETNLSIFNLNCPFN